VKREVASRRVEFLVRGGFELAAMYGACRRFD
jgi:hypothetical protein